MFYNFGNRFPKLKRKMLVLGSISLLRPTESRLVLCSRYVLKSMFVKSCLVQRQIDSKLHANRI